MRLGEIVKAYIRNAENVISEENYSTHTVLQAYVLMKRDVEKALTALARRHGRCVSCIHSEPDEKQPVDLRKRKCELGLKEEECGSWEPLEINV
jgi:hypothetical protein